ncbi:MAG: DUF4123 domain-containing protein [Vicinamibacterales bacterium]
MSAPHHLVLRVADGGASHQLVGRPVVVGRADDCDLVVPDPGLSRHHFELTWRADSWQLRDLDSRNGVTVNGNRVRQVAVNAGDRIEAGSVVFTLELPRSRVTDSADAPLTQAPAAADPEAAALPLRELYIDTAPTLAAEAPPPAPGSLQQALMAILPVTPGFVLYAVVDGAKAFELAFAGRLMGHRLLTLFLGDLASAVAHVGPCLVVLGNERSAFLARWTDACGKHAGVLFESDAPLDALCDHLRHVFVAMDEDGQEYFFRFYDPRVLRTFLPTCRADELLEFFGPLRRLVAEDEAGEGFTIFTLDDSGVREQSVVAVPAPV